MPTGVDALDADRRTGLGSSSSVRRSVTPVARWAATVRIVKTRSSIRDIPWRRASWETRLRARAHSRAPVVSATKSHPWISAAATPLSSGSVRLGARLCYTILVLKLRHICALAYTGVTAACPGLAHASYS